MTRLTPHCRQMQHRNLNLSPYRPARAAETELDNWDIDPGEWLEPAIRAALIFVIRYSRAPRKRHRKALCWNTKDHDAHHRIYAFVNCDVFRNWEARSINQRFYSQLIAYQQLNHARP